MKKIIFGCILAFIVKTSISQDTITVMFYNVLSYTESTYEKTHYFKDIAQYIRPDIMVLNEISSDSSSFYILNNVLNINGNNDYSKAEFTDGPDSDNMLFYKKDKFTLFEQDTILTELRIINGYSLSFRDTITGNQDDSAIFHIYSAHLKASTGSTNEQQRLYEVQKFRTHLENSEGEENVMFCGDMNFYSSTEPALLFLLSEGDYQMFDPLDSIGDWHDNPLYAHVHTQSTRTTAFGGGATGGMDDRFDFIFISEDLKNGTQKARYIPGTYWAFGNDGYHLNDSITALPQYNNLPDSITTSLYNMSDHIPVIMKILIDKNASVQETNQINSETILITPNPVSDKMTIILPEEIQESLHYTIQTMSGKKILSGIIENDPAKKYFDLDVSQLNNGIYVLQFILNGKKITGKFSVLK